MTARSAGRISRSNEKRSEEHFKRMDTNGDDFIDEAEKRAAFKKMREHRKEWREKHQNPDAAKPADTK